MSMTLTFVPARRRLVAALAALFVALPAGAYVDAAVTGDDAPTIQVAKKGSFDITE